MRDPALAVRGNPHANVPALHGCTCSTIQDHDTGGGVQQPAAPVMAPPVSLGAGVSYPSAQRKTKTSSAPTAGSEVGSVDVLPSPTGDRSINKRGRRHRPAGNSSPHDASSLINPSSLTIRSCWQNSLQHYTPTTLTPSSAGCMAALKTWESLLSLSCCWTGWTPSSPVLSGTGSWRGT